MLSFNKLSAVHMNLNCAFENCMYTISIFTVTLLEITALLMTEPDLQPFMGESFLSHHSANDEDGADLDVEMYGFWGGRLEKAFVGMRVFSPNGQSNCHGSLSSVCY